MTKNLGGAKQWELCAVLVSVLVGAPVVAWSGDRMKGCPDEGEKVELTVRQIDAQTYEVTTSRPDVPLYCGLGKDARIVPAFKEGESRGLKLFSIRPGSVYEQIGLRNGDVVRSLNGMPLSSPDKALDADLKLRDAERIEAQIERGGKPLQLQYLVKKPAQPEAPARQKAQK